MKDLAIALEDRPCAPAEMGDALGRAVIRVLEEREGLAQGVKQAVSQAWAREARAQG